MRIILFSLVSWLIFLFIDWVVFAFFILHDAKTLTITFIPDTFTVLLTLACYAGIGLCAGFLIKGLETVGKSYISLNPTQWLHLTASLSVVFNSAMNIVLLLKKSIFTGPFFLKSYPQIAVVVLFVLLMLLAAVKITVKIRRGPFALLLSLCPACEIFWNIIREGLYPGGYLREFFMQGSIVFVMVTATAAGSLLFVCFYYFPLRLVSKNSQKLLLQALPWVLLLAGMVFARTCQATPAISPVQKPNIIVLILDTVRADHLSCYGYPQTTTPNIDAVASEAVHYRRAYAASSWTLPSIATVLTGLYPCGHGAHRVREGGIGNGKIPIRGLSGSHVTFAELLKKDGYNTAGVISCAFLTKSYGLHQGFDYYDDYIPSGASFLSTCAAVSFLNIFLPIDDFLSSSGHNGSKTAQQVNESVTKWIQHRDQTAPFFILAHYFDAHHPFFPEKPGMQSVPPAIRNRYGHSTNYLDFEKKVIDAVISGEKKLLPDEQKFLTDNYDREIRLLDRKIGELLSFLKEKNLYDESLIIIVADHGESFGEHSLMLHGLSLYEDNLHVPLLIKYPLSCATHGTVEYPVSLTGVLPTVLSFLSIPSPDFIQGSPFAEPQNQKILSMLYYSGSAPWPLPDMLRGDQVSLLEQDQKVIWFGNGQRQLYDLTRDPEELHGTILEEGIPAGKILADLTAHIKQFTMQATGEHADQSIDKEAIKNLRNLGYIK